MNIQDFSITPYEGATDIATTPGFTKMEMDESGKMQIQALLHELPSVSSTQMLANAYTVSVPQGVKGTLMQYKNGGFGTAMVDQSGKIAGHASMQPMAAQALAANCFNIMSIASSQYYLKQINDELKMIRCGLDKILDFLHGDKKAELMAQASFVKYAYQNYASIMAHDQQRAGVIAGLIEAKKVALQDIEFYLAELDRVTEDKKTYSTTNDTTAFDMKETLFRCLFQGHFTCKIEMKQVPVRLIQAGKAFLKVGTGSCF